MAPRGWRLGLDRMEEFVRRADLTAATGGISPKFLHVAGTNGKGSVTAYLQSMLVESGYWTGAFFSPYVYDPRERIQFNRTYISENAFAMLTQLLQPTAESLSETDFGGITEFEFKTAVGFAFWKELECEWVALETGLGGRLDATNVVTPVCSVIVSIGLDHTNVLGHTIEEIAFEKAGIMKPGKPVVLGEMPPAALEVIRKQAAQLACPLWHFGEEVRLEEHGDSFRVATPVATHEDLKPGLFGPKQAHNMALAVAAMDASGAGRTLKGYVDGAYKAFVPGRFERRSYQGVPFILDGAHNADAGRTLAENLREAGMQNKRIVLITGMVQGHDPGEFFSEFAPLISSAHISPIDFHRAVSPQELKETVKNFVPRTEAYNSPAEALAAAVDDAALDATILVTGSFYLVGEIGRLLE